MLYYRRQAGGRTFVLYELKVLRPATGFPPCTSAVAPVLAAFSLGLTFANVNMLFNRSFQSMQRVWLPLYVGLACLGLNAVLAWILLHPFGAAGIALSTSLVSIFNCVVLGYLLRDRIGTYEGRRMAVAVGKAVVCAAAVAAVAYVVWLALEGFAEAGFAQALVALLIAVASSGAAYVGAARLLRLEELSLVWNIIRRRVRRSA